MAKNNNNGNIYDRFRKYNDRLLDKIDKRETKGIVNEDQDVAHTHYVGTNEKGERCWSF